jgi:hypothetical protein
MFDYSRYKKVKNTNSKTHEEKPIAPVDFDPKNKKILQELVS